MHPDIKIKIKLLFTIDLFFKIELLKKIQSFALRIKKDFKAELDDKKRNFYFNIFIRHM